MKAEALKQYLKNARKVIHARLVSASRDGDAEIFEVEVDIDLPQRPLHDIHAKERMRLRLPDDDGMPTVFALRKSFPALPHTMVNGGSYPRQLCLYEKPWAEERTNWSPKNFVERIRHWLHATADGTLHPHDQALEPVMQDSPAKIVLPEIRYSAGAGVRIERFFLQERRPMFWLAYRQPPPGADKTAVAFPALIVEGPVVHHGIMHRLPMNLGELDELLSQLGGSLTKSVAAQLEKIRAELKTQSSLPLLLVVELPKTRVKGGPVETVEHRAFFVGKNVDELFAAKTDYVKDKLLFVPKKQEQFLDPDQLTKIRLIPLSVRWHLTAVSAAVMNGHVASTTKIVSIGGGALGSQLTNNLWRGGFGDWTVVDDDLLDAHNPARHLFDSHAVGLPKAKSLVRKMEAVFPDRPPPTAIVCNYLAPGEQAAALGAAMKDAELILDFSASVTVERTLSVDATSSARRMSAYLNQRGDESVLLVEDAQRENQLFWLEALYYRAVTTDPKLAGHFDSMETVAHRYGNGCREISAVVPQDGVALHAGLLAHEVRRAAASRDAAITIRRWSRESGGVTAVDVPVAKPLMTDAAGWRVLIHPEVLQELAALRAKSLPAETGGIMVGVVDRTLRMIAVTGIFPAPSDSEAWPTSFIRGANGLSAAVDRLSKRSLRNVIYVGEWHSHPEGCDATPSVQDVAAVAICAPNTRADGLPTLMMIVAAHEIAFVVQATDENKLWIIKNPVRPPS